MLFLSEDGFKIFLEQLVSSKNVIAPVETDGCFEFKTIKRAGEASLTYSNTRLPPKRFFLPQREMVFKHDPKKGALHEPLGSFEMVLLGVRPCDASALRILDSILLKPPNPDPFYESRRRSITVVSLSCAKPGDECFCNVFEAGPVRGSGEDITLTRITGGLLVEVRSSRGQALVDVFKNLFEKAGAEHLEEYRELSNRLTGEMNSRIGIAGERLVRLEKTLDEGFFQKEAQRCVECSLCSFTCPVCYCFDTEDYLEKNIYVRAKGWDTCASPLFTRMASGLDPRASRVEMFCHRFCHKLSRIPLAFNSYGCVGCGRCVSLCPAGVDIREVLKRWG
ncbi:MAG: 4Fe-4S dicluster domain-containing protein [Candidatus Brockarchaeota archaeon]|nr:4Fe-4S dicluster domain-containing protein [Candidatus Brockarchaeota archaeon]MBO3808131.1 4Fe-4S dicluster domain-containing protein [Candidatus Brockarchaeota archaeon]